MSIVFQSPPSFFNTVHISAILASDMVLVTLRAYQSDGHCEPYFVLPERTSSPRVSDR